MPHVKHFPADKMQFEPYGGPPGEAKIARLVGPELSSSMGGGVATFDACSIEWTVLYDELIVVLEGTFRLRLGGSESRTIEARPGDVIWLPRVRQCVTRVMVRRCFTPSVRSIGKRAIACEAS